MNPEELQTKRKRKITKAKLFTIAEKGSIPAHNKVHIEHFFINVMLCY